MYNYLKALHVIFIVTWFAGLFYVVRLFIYNREAEDKPEHERKILQNQFSPMIKRLWLGITWPSCIVTLIFGISLLSYYPVIPGWLWAKLGFILGLLLYHGSLHMIYNQQRKGVFKYSSLQLRIWNEVATLFLVSIVMLVVVKDEISLLWGGIGIITLAGVFMIVIRILKNKRKS